MKWYKQKHKAINNIKKSIYSIPEIAGNKIKNFNIIGCPGCYPTSVLIPLIPLLKKHKANIKEQLVKRIIKTNKKWHVKLLNMFFFIYKPEKPVHFIKM